MMYAVSANGTSKDFPKMGSDYCRLYSMSSLRDNLDYAIPDLASGICSGSLSIILPLFEKGQQVLTILTIFLIHLVPLCIYGFKLQV